MKKQTYIGVDDLEKLLDRRFSVLAMAEQIGKMGNRIEKNETDIKEIKGELRQINRKITDQNDRQTQAVQQFEPERIMTERLGRFQDAREAN